MYATSELSVIRLGAGVLAKDQTRLEPAFALKLIDRFLILVQGLVVQVLKQTELVYEARLRCWSPHCSARTSYNVFTPLGI